MLKEQLLEESKTIDASVELDGIFEGADLSEDVKNKFAIVFETAVKTHALALAESHINAIAEKADEKVEKEVDEKAEKAEKKLVESADKFFTHLASEWLKENQVEVDKSIKSDLFESMFVGLKGLFVEHNVTLPAESVDVVAEMEEELAESKTVASDLFEQNTLIKEELTSLKRDVLVKEHTSKLTESQKEKVASLIEGVAFNEKFETKLVAIVEMAGAKTSTPEAKPLTENAQDPNGLNFVVENVVVEAKQPNSMMNLYVNAAKNI